MSISSISSGSAAALYSPQPAQLQRQQAVTARSNSSSDVVSISPQARQLSGDGDPQALEGGESLSAKASELSKGKD